MRIFGRALSFRTNRSVLVDAAGGFDRRCGDDHRSRICSAYESRDDVRERSNSRGRAFDHGPELLRVLRAAVGQRKIDVRTNSRVLRINTNGSGAVSGVSRSRNGCIRSTRLRPERSWLPPAGSVPIRKWSRNTVPSVWACPRRTSLGGPAKG